MKNLMLVLFLLMLSFRVMAAAVPAYNPNMGRAVGELVAQKATKRITPGRAANDPNYNYVAANDPRYGATVNGVSAAVVTIAGGVVAGATWPVILAAAGISVVASVALPFLIDKVISWFWKPDGTIEVGSMTEFVPIDNSTGLPLNGPYWRAYTQVGPAVIGADPEAVGQQAISIRFSPENNAAYKGYRDVSCSKTSSIIYKCAFNAVYRQPSQTGDELTTASSLTVEYVASPPAHNACPKGKWLRDKECVAYDFKPLPAIPGTGTGLTPADAINRLPEAALDTQVHPQQLAAAANALWRNAALQPDYRGLPYDAADPITEGDVEDWRVKNPNSYPKVRDFVSPAMNPKSTPQLPIPPVTAVTNPGTQPINPPAGATKIDLGPDPVIGSPELEQTPTGKEIFAPINDALEPLKGFQVPSHSAQCPTGEFNFSLMGHPFSGSFDAHCQLFEQHKEVMSSAALLMWALAALFIVLAA
ncbi:hypothetical protein HQN60_01270 [Deefgea piscis]|uniref:Uncharacterized protein n=1 Tax=Deefgea piscis TaxID=2739061 RepID=A0A6M8SMT8_9NEIS|nr:hypothetical protein [Deefgea piscis]QKJ65474.1 hypothetical protein HQN60_01270 [Deefgea piscis]